jgi:hypothetical protein
MSKRERERSKERKKYVYGKEKKERGKTRKI